MNEPTAETASYFTMVSGVAKFNSAGGVLMGVIGNKATWEMPYFALGHTGFVNEAVVMSGGTVSNYRFYYQIDTGSGYSALSAQLTAAQLGTALSGVSVDPAVGFKLKLTIETTSTNTTAITFLTARTTTTESAQSTNFYPLDQTDFTFSVKDEAGAPVTGFEYRIYLKDPAAGIIGNTELDGSESYGGSSKTYQHQYSSNTDVVLQIIKDGYEESLVEYTLNTTPQSVAVYLRTERNI
jgi:hypothetical protein